MSRALIERHGIPFAAIESINAAFARGAEDALSLTSDEFGDRLSIAGTPEDVAERGPKGRLRRPIQPRRAHACGPGDSSRLGRHRDPRAADAVRARAPDR
jgi:hypothetical protein